jgi:spore maturation protein CgeB
MRIAFFGSSLVSSYWNGAATYYRGIIRALAARGHQVTFFEPDAYERQQHRDMENPSWAEVVVYAAEESAALRAVHQARDFDLIVKASGVGVFDDLLEQSVISLKNSANLIAFWDVDAPATLDRLHHDPFDPFHRLVPAFDLVFTYGGGNPVIEGYERLGARLCVPVYNALDPLTHYPVEPDSRFDADLGFLGNRLPDRETRVEQFFLKPACMLTGMQFLLGGAGWSDKALSANVKYFDHIYTRDHNAFNSTPRAVINISRESMAHYGFSPATRVFEAAGAAGCIITDKWEGVELFLEPDREILVADSADEVVLHLLALSPERARRIGAAARKRVMAQHTYTQRAVQVEQVLEGKCAPVAGLAS